jgi:hypothetical protein
VHTSQVNHLHVNDLHLTGGQLVVAVSGTVSRARGNGKIVGPKIADLDHSHPIGVLARAEKKVVGMAL